MQQVVLASYARGVPQQSDFRVERAPVPEAGEGITECVWMSLDEAAARISYDNARDVVNAAREALGRDAPGSWSGGTAPPV